MATPTGNSKQAFWLNHVVRWLNSRIAVRAYCNRHHLAEASFYFWRRTLVDRGLVVWPIVVTAKSPTPAFVPVHVATPASSSSSPSNPTSGATSDAVSTAASSQATTQASSPVSISATSSSLEVILGNGRVVRVPAGFDAETLHRVVATLEVRPC